MFLKGFVFLLGMIRGTTIKPCLYMSVMLKRKVINDQVIKYSIIQNAPFSDCDARKFEICVKFSSEKLVRSSYLFSLL